MKDRGEELNSNDKICLIKALLRDARFRTALVWVVALIAFILVMTVIAFRAKNAWKVVKAKERMYIRDFDFQTGDLILTSSIGMGPGFFIKLGTGSPISHVAITYVDPRTGQTYFWEINSHGTRLATIEDFIRKARHHRVYVRKLNGPPVSNDAVEHIISSQWENVFNFDIPVAWYHRMLYPKLFPIPFMRGKQWKEDQRTCAHMTTEAYAALGVLDYETLSKSHDIDATFPFDYARKVLDPKVLPLSPEYSFGTLTRLDLFKREERKQERAKRKEKKKERKHTKAK
jgi:hypothetical protein